MPKSYIGFNESFVYPILRFDKYQTLRYGWKSLPNEGDTVGLQTSDGDVFAYARIDTVKIVSPEDVVEATLTGHKNYSSVDDLLDHMSEYYDDVTADSDLIFIEFTVSKVNI